MEKSRALGKGWIYETGEPSLALVRSWEGHSLPVIPPFSFPNVHVFQASFHAVEAYYRC